MTFTSLEFLFMFIPVFLLLYFVIPGARWRNVWLCVASIAFYTWGEPSLVLLMLGSVGLNYVLAIVLAAREQRDWRRAWLIVGLVANIGMLVLFKYSGFAVSVVSEMTGNPIAAPTFPLPLGVSFYTFQALAYLIDLYRGKYPVERNPIRLVVVIAAFPTITAGPILRYADMRDQLTARQLAFPDAIAGLRRILIGVSKKVLIANSVAYVATQVFSQSPSQYGLAGAWLGAICWTMQIYFDFSGYTDIAIGLGMMMGFRYPENFNYPYIATSVADFWRRWHMSLSTFFRDYVYFPLGGNRVSKPRWILNMAVVWALTGIWHGANWTFMVWGLYYGAILVLERLVWAKWLEKAPGAMRHMYTMVVVICGWVLFMSPTIGAAGDVFRAMVGLDGVGSLSNLVMMRVIQPTYLLALVAAIIGSVPWYRRLWVRTGESEAMGVAADVLIVVAFAVSSIMLVVGTFSPFVYFKF